MPAEQALTKARELSGPSYGSGDGGSGSFAARLEQTAALLAPVALIVGLALSGGGFDVSTRHIAGLAVWLVVVGLLVLGAGSRARLGWPFYSAIGLFGCLALLSAISSLWSGSVELSVIEADRVLVYLGFFLAAFLIAQTDESRQRFAEGIAIGVAITVLLGLASRLLPHVIEVSDGARQRPAPALSARLLERERRRCAESRSAMLLWMSRNAALDRAALGLGGGHARGRADPLFHLLEGRRAEPRDRRPLPDRPLARPALDAGHAGDRRARRAAGACSRFPAHRSLADNVASQTSVDQGVTVLLILLAGTALALGALRAPAAPGDPRRTAATARAVELSRDPKVLRTRPRSALAVVAIAAAIVFGGRAWHQFSKLRPPVPRQPRPALLRLLQRRPARLLAGRDRRLRRKAAARPRRRHLPVLLGAAALDRP